MRANRGGPTILPAEEVKAEHEAAAAADGPAETGVDPS
jgi:hypothetical protein